MSKLVDHQFNLYLINFNHYTYDQYDSILVAAKDETDAINFLKQEHPNILYGDINWDNGYNVELINGSNYKEVTEIIGSFNAG